jgi:hypothetical protein
MVHILTDHKSLMYIFTHADLNMCQRRWLELIKHYNLEGLREVTGGEPNHILLQELAYVPSSNPKSKTLQEGYENTNQQYRNGSFKVMNAAEKEWDQLDTRLAKYGQNSERTSD